MNCSSSSTIVVVVVSLLVLSLLFTGTQGIRFKKVLFSSEKHEDERIHEERKSSLTKTSDGSVAEAVLCKEETGNCNTGMNRKLISTTSTTSTSTTSTIIKNEEKNTGENYKAKAKAKANATSTSKSKSIDGKTFGEQTEESHNSSRDNLYVDITDLEEMDYSPARRKPPIHN